jgi:hypothetical protein
MRATRKKFVRQKTTICGKNRKQVKVYNYSDEQQEAVKGRRNQRQNVTPPKQRDLNDRHAKEYFGQLVMSNFIEDDYILHATYTPETLPATIDEARHSFRNFMRRVSDKCEKNGYAKPKFINVTERGESNGRIHHHCFLKCELSRDEVEDLWRLPRKRGEKKGESIGYINVDRLQGELDPIIGYVAKDFGAEDEPKETAAPTEAIQAQLALATGDDENALAEQPKGKAGRPKNQRRWTQSQNLVKPQESTNDNAWSKRELERTAKEQQDRAYWEKRFPGWTLIDSENAVKARYNEETGWSLDIKLRKKDVLKEKSRK